MDAASGGFVAPFCDEDLEWDFRVPRVQSINASGHKYGLVYPGVGWIIWRDHEALPQDLIFDVEYLGGHMPTFALNFSRPGAQVVAQYFMFLRLGREGYRRIQETCCETASWIAGQVDSMEQFELVSQEPGIPVVAFKIVGDRGYTVYDVSETLRTRGWLVPAYPMPPDMQDISVLRVVVRNGLSRDLAGILVDDLKSAVERLERGGGMRSDDPDGRPGGFPPLILVAPKGSFRQPRCRCGSSTSCTSRRSGRPALRARRASRSPRFAPRPRRRSDRPSWRS